MGMSTVMEMDMRDMNTITEMGMSTVMEMDMRDMVARGTHTIMGRGMKNMITMTAKHMGGTITNYCAKYQQHR